MFIQLTELFFRLGVELVKHCQLFVYNSIGMVDFTCNSQHIGCGWVWYWNNCEGVLYSKGSNQILLYECSYLVVWTVPSRQWPYIVYFLAWFLVTFLTGKWNWQMFLETNGQVLIFWAAFVYGSQTLGMYKICLERKY